MMSSLSDAVAAAFQPTLAAPPSASLERTATNASADYSLAHHYASTTTFTLPLGTNNFALRPLTTPLPNGQHSRTNAFTPASSPLHTHSSYAIPTNTNAFYTSLGAIPPPDSAVASFTSNPPNAAIYGYAWSRANAYAHAPHPVHNCGSGGLNPTSFLFTSLPGISPIAGGYHSNQFFPIHPHHPHQQLDAPRSNAPSHSTVMAEMMDADELDVHGAEGDTYQCKFCDKAYVGKHARSIWRRHLNDKHQIPLSSQPRRTRWDNEDSNRPKTEEERRERTLESKRRWARKNRAEKKALREAGIAVPKGARQIAMAARVVRAGQQVAAGGGGQQVYEQYTRQGSSPAPGSEAESVEGGYYVAMPSPNSGFSGYPCPSPPQIHRTASAPIVLTSPNAGSSRNTNDTYISSNRAPLRPLSTSLGRVGHSTTFAPPQYMFSDEPVSSLAAQVHVGWRDGTRSTRSSPGPDEEGDALVALKRSAGKPVSHASGQWTRVRAEYEVPLRGEGALTPSAATMSWKPKLPLRKTRISDEGSASFSGSEEPSFALSGVGGELEEESPATSLEGSDDGAVVGKRSMSEEAEEEQVAQKRLQVSSETLARPRAMRGMTDDEEDEEDDEEPAAFFDLYSHRTPARPASAGARPFTAPFTPSCGVPDAEDLVTATGSGSDFQSSPAVPFIRARSAEDLDLHHHRSPVGGLYAPQTSVSTKTQYRLQAPSGSCASSAGWSTLQTPAIGRTFPPTSIGMAGATETTAIAKVGGAKAAGETSSEIGVFSSPAHASFSKDLGLAAPSGGGAFGASMDELLSMRGLFMPAWDRKRV